jgi:hypothetical protein
MWFDIQGKALKKVHGFLKGFSRRTLKKLYQG